MPEMMTPMLTERVILAVSDITFTAKLISRKTKMSYPSCSIIINKLIDKRLITSTLYKDLDVNMRKNLRRLNVGRFGNMLTLTEIGKECKEHLIAVRKLIKGCKI